MFSPLSQILHLPPKKIVDDISERMGEVEFKAPRP